MSGPAYPTILQQPFAYAGLKNTIPYGAASPNASWHDGFPAVTMEPISSGGVPPAGQDFNGIYYELSAVLVYANGGGRFKWDSGFASAVGYPVGAVIASNDFSHSFECLTAGASTDPNTLANVDNVNWAVWGGGNTYGSGNYAVASGTANAPVIATIPAIAQLYNGMTVTFKASATNTGAATLNAGSGAVTLVRRDGTVLQPGDVESGVVYSAVYDVATTSFYLTGYSEKSGKIDMTGASTAPVGWLLCDGSAVSRSVYSALFAAIGTTYGAGNGTTTFNVPSMGGRMPIGENGTYALGSTGGSAAALLTHTHFVANTDNSNTSGTYLAQEDVAGSDVNYTLAGSSTVPSIFPSSGPNVASASNTLPPYLAVNFIIKN